MTTEDSINSFGQQFINFIKNIDFKPIIPDIRTVIQTSIDRNFSEEGRYGSGKYGGGVQKWVKSQRALRQSGQTLSDTGQLAASIRVNVTSSNGIIQIEIGSNKPYAAIHNFGGVIQKAASSKLYTQNRYKRGSKKGQYKKGTSYGQGSTTGAHEIKIVARPFLVIQDEDVQQIMVIVNNYLKRIFNR